ncbi:helicase-associated domain-containing protein [Kroppenstedtia guangzhouensis]|nr:helicase-associated domain-containing protein [Kroppenstedtia guangzhouensis]
MKLSLSACVKGLSKEVCKQMADIYRCDADPDSLIDTILQNLKSGEFIQRAHPWELTLMQFLSFHWGDRVIPEERLSELLPLSPSCCRVAIVLLRRKGLLFRLRQHRLGWMYWCPRDVRRSFLQSRVQLPPLPEERRVEASQRFRGLWDPLFHFAVLLEDEGLNLTREGTVPRREERKLDAELELEEKWLTHSQWGEGVGSPAIRLVSDFLQALDILKKEGRQWKIQREPFRRWLQKPWPDRIAELFRLTEELLLKDRPAWDGLWWWMERHLTDWVSAKEICLGWLSEIGGVPRPGFVKEVVERWLHPLAVMGWVEARAGTEGEQWRWTSWIQPGDEVPVMNGYVKPDLEVLLPPFPPLTHRFLLAQFADYMGGETLLSYVLNPKSVRRGAERGLSAERMLDTLREISGGPVPDPVTENIRLWAKENRPLLRKGWVLQFPVDGSGKEEMGEVHSGLEPLSEGVFFLPEALVSSVRKQLAEEGRPPLELEEIHWWSSLPDTPSPEKAKELEAATVESRFPSLEEAIPGFNKLPKVWISGLRSYHPGTLRNLLRQATDMKLDLLIRSGENPPVRFTPLKMFQKEGYWHVTGRDGDGCSRRYTLEDFREVQILTPWQEGL